MRCEFCGGYEGDTIYTADHHVKKRWFQEEQLSNGCLQLICNQCIARRFLLWVENEKEQAGDSA